MCVIELVCLFFKNNNNNNNAKEGQDPHRSKQPGRAKYFKPDLSLAWKKNGGAGCPRPATSSPFVWSQCSCWKPERDHKKTK